MWNPLYSGILSLCLLCSWNLFSYPERPKTRERIRTIPRYKKPVRHTIISPLMTVLPESTPCVEWVKKIDVLPTPAYNPSLLALDHGFLMLYRFPPDVHKPDYTYLGYATLDPSWNITTPHQPLRDLHSYEPVYGEDPRVIEWGNTPYILFHRVVNSTRQKGYLWIAKLIEQHGQWYCDKPVLLKHRDYFKYRDVEKNWMPFVYKNKLFVSYTVNPYTVLEVNPLSGLCIPCYSFSYQDHWERGDLRGSTNAVPFENGYLTLFHSWILMRSQLTQGTVGKHYFIGALWFSNTPPFAPQTITLKPILNYRLYCPHPKDGGIIFPCGMILHKNKLYVSYGQRDLTCWVMCIDPERLKQFMTPLEPSKLSPIHAPPSF